MPVSSRDYTEQDVQQFFDTTLTAYLSFWDSNGVLHTGYFAGPGDTDYQAASDRTSEILAGYTELGPDSHVLDVGCGCGNYLLDLAGWTGCSGHGLDLSEERVKFARDKLTAHPDRRLTFDHGSATAMPYADGTFSHVVSQDAMCLIPDKPRTHAEVYRVLRPGGLFVFSDFLQPKEEVSERARRHVYDRVRWNGGFSLVGYQQALETAGFEIVLARNVSDHLRQTYSVLGVTATERAASAPDEATRDWMLGFAESCGEMLIAIDDGEFGWGILVARKKGENA
ncbi:MAG: methyltransferase domain-containing protein [Streptosporangiaceae bacterium]